MTLSIRDVQTDRLARDLAKRTGKPITTVVKEALSDYAAKAPISDAEERIRGIHELLAKLDKAPIKDHRSAKEIMDDLYDENGLPK